MGHAVDFYGSNFTFSAPPDREDIYDLKCFFNGKATAFCIQLTPEELEEVRDTGKVWCTIFTPEVNGSPLFLPVFIGGQDNVRSVMLDRGGVWRKKNGDLG